ncbi:MAG TPA: FtsW/RodA/SpoVE family cell cycle protein [Thermomicrobiales bacterium]|nr:FtsW/RodA/SpoVE family cell cycle protein [Thermomicrobiales bacterium]
MLLSRHQRMTVHAPSATSDRWRDFDLMMFLTILVLTGFGIVTIWSAVGLPPLLSNNDGTKQAIFSAIGLALMMMTAAIDYRYLESAAWILYAAGIGALVVVLSPLGYEVPGTGAQNWINLGFTTIQPSEFVKITTIIGLSAFISSRGEAMKDFGNFIIAGLIVALPTGLILLGPDLGQAMVYIALWASALIVARTRKRYLIALLVAMPAVTLFAWKFVLHDYQRERILLSYDPGSAPQAGGYQIIQARISIGAGGLTGSGIRGGTQSTLNLLGVRESDFIFAHASGMFGFIGMVALITALVIFLWRCLKVAEVSRDSFGQCIAICTTGILFFQAFLNIGMNVGIMPVAGITLPFVSAGVSSLWTFMILAGILQSIRMNHRKLVFERR